MPRFRGSARRTSWSTSQPYVNAWYPDFIPVNTTFGWTHTASIPTKRTSHLPSEGKRRSLHVVKILNCTIECFGVFCHFLSHFLPLIFLLLPNIFAERIFYFYNLLIFPVLACCIIWNSCCAIGTDSVQIISIFLCWKALISACQM